MQNYRALADVELTVGPINVIFGPNGAGKSNQFRFRPCRGSSFLAVGRQDRLDDRFLLLVDDIEADRADSIQETFDRYRLALDTILTDSQSRRASVHFLVNMLEAYYFADSRAVNSVLNTDLDDYEGDVETIRNPKSRMKNLCPGFDVVEDGCRIIGRLSICHVLSREDTCSSLRTMFAWIFKAIGEPECELRQVLVGGYNDVTKGQICLLSP